MSAVPPVDQRPWYTLQEAATLLGFTTKTAHNKVHLGAFPVPHFKLGRHVAVMKDVVAAYFEQRSTEGMQQLRQKSRARA